MTVHIRTATTADAPLLARLNVPVQELHAAALPHLFKPAQATGEIVAHFAALLARPDAVGFIAEADGQPAGYAVAMIVDRPENAFTYASRSLLLNEISVDPAMRRHGIGSALTAAVLRLARENGIKIVQLKVYDWNKDALAFYARQGFHSNTIQLEMDLSVAEDIDAMG